MKENLIKPDFVDVFHEKGVFETEETEKVFFYYYSFFYLIL